MQKEKLLKKDLLMRVNSVSILFTIQWVSLYINITG